MSPFEVVAAVIAVFFGSGIVMGVLIVVALPVLRRYRDERWRMRYDRRTYLESRDGREPPSFGDEQTKPPRWPQD